MKRRLKTECLESGGEGAMLAAFHRMGGVSLGHGRTKAQSHASSPGAAARTALLGSIFLGCYRALADGQT